MRGLIRTGHGVEKRRRPPDGQAIVRSPRFFSPSFPTKETPFPTSPRINAIFFKVSSRIPSFVRSPCHGIRLCHGFVTCCCCACRRNWKRCFFISFSFSTSFLARLNSVSNLSPLRFFERTRRNFGCPRIRPCLIHSTSFVNLL